MAMFYLWRDDPGAAVHKPDKEREGALTRNNTLSGNATDALARNNTLSGYAPDAIALFNKRSRGRKPLRPIPN
jgi:hypothetical protein